MNPQEVKSVLKEIFLKIAPEIDFDSLVTSQSFRDQADLDSFNFYRIIVLINQTTGVNVPDSKIAEFNNLNHLIIYISEKSNKR